MAICKTPKPKVTQTASIVDLVDPVPVADSTPPVEVQVSDTASVTARPSTSLVVWVDPAAPVADSPAQAELPAHEPVPVSEADAAVSEVDSDAQPTTGAKPASDLGHNNPPDDVDVALQSGEPDHEKLNSLILAHSMKIMRAHKVGEASGFLIMKWIFFCVWCDENEATFREKLLRGMPEEFVSEIFGQKLTVQHLLDLRVPTNNNDPSYRSRIKVAATYLAGFKYANKRQMLDKLFSFKGINPVIEERDRINVLRTKSTDQNKQAKGKKARSKAFGPPTKKSNSLNPSPGGRTANIFAETPLNDVDVSNYGELRQEAESELLGNAPDIADVSIAAADGGAPAVGDFFLALVYCSEEDKTSIKAWIDHPNISTVVSSACHHRGITDNDIDARVAELIQNEAE